jgi:hypothetical protein
LCGANGESLRTFYDELPKAVAQVIELLGVDTARYGLP